MDGYKSRSLVVLSMLLLAGMLLAPDGDSLTWFSAPTSYAKFMALCATIPNSVAVFVASLGANDYSVSSVALEPPGMVSFPPSPPQDSGAPTLPPPAVPTDSIPLHAMDQALPVAMLDREENARYDIAGNLVARLGSEKMAVRAQSHRELQVGYVQTGIVSTLAGGGAVSGNIDATGTSARFNQPNGVALTSDGATLYVGDYSNHKIRRVVTGTGAVTTLSGIGSKGSTDGVAAVATFNSPSGLALKSDNSIIYVCDRFNHKIRSVATADGGVTTLSGDGNAGSDDGIKALASFHYPRSLVLNSEETVLYVAESHNHKIRSVTVSTGAVTTLCGDGNIGSDDGSCASASFNYPFGIAYFLDPVSLSGFLYVSDLYNNKIRKILVSQQTVTTLAGDGNAGSDDGAGTTASLNQPTGLALSSDGSKLYASMMGGNTIRAVLTDGKETFTVAVFDLPARRLAPLSNSRPSPATRFLQPHQHHVST